MFKTVLKYQHITTEKLLSGDPTPPFDNNTEILLAAQEYIKDTKRFWFSLYGISLSLSLSLSLSVCVIILQ